jgi:hypothetical protein
LEAMLAPMIPSPMNPTFIVTSGPRRRRRRPLARYFLCSNTLLATRAEVIAFGQPA